MIKYLTGVAVCVLAVLLLADFALAQDAAHAATSGSGLTGLGAGLGIGLAAIGGGFGVSKVISAALEGISRNPAASGQLFLPWMLGCVFVEIAVILAFVITNGLK